MLVFLVISAGSIEGVCQSEQYISHRIEWTNDTEDSSSLTFDNNGVYYDINPSVSLYYDIRAGRQGILISSTLLVDKTEIITVSEAVKAKITNKEYTYSIELFETKNQYMLSTSVLPVKLTEDGRVERILTFRTQLNYAPSIQSGSRNPDATFKSVLADGDIYKLAVNKSGIYKIDRPFLETKLGINLANINPKKIKIYGNRGGRVPEANSEPRIDDLEELGIWVAGESDGRFDNSDYIIFYAEGADLWKYVPNNNNYVFDKNIYDENNYYFIKIDGQDGKRISKTNELNIITDAETASYDMLQRVEDDKTNLLGAFSGTEGTGKDWYGDYFNGSAREYNLTSKFDFTGLVLSDPIATEMAFAGRSRVTSSVTLSIGNKSTNISVPSVNVLNAESEYARRVVINDTFLASASNPAVKINYPAVSAESEGWLDYLQIISGRELSLNAAQLQFRKKSLKNISSATFLVKNFSSQVVWDVTDPFNPAEVTIKDGKLKFYTNNQVKEFVAHNNTVGAFEPTALGKINNQNLHRVQDEQMIIVYHPKFKDAAIRLAEHRQKHSQIKVIAAETTEIYHEFSGGKADPGAIRDMARLLLGRNPLFKYVLLFGDGSYDYKGLVKDIAVENFVPVYETDESLDPIDGYPSDDFYGLLGDDEGVGLRGGLDVYIGRLPAKSAEEANILVDKIIHYDSAPVSQGDWRMRAGYVADDEDGNTHLRDMDDIARADEMRHPLMLQEKVYADAYKQVSTPGENRYPDANKTINNNIFKGQLTLTYLGHGGPLGWAQERILTVPEINTWTNMDALTVMVTATCSFGAYDDPSVLSPAEYAVLNPKGGAIAMMTTTRAVYTNSNKQLTDGAHELMYQKKDGIAPALGYILSEGKNKYQGDFFRINSRKFTLLGDPSQQIALPKLNIITTKINGKDAQSVTDTINALEKVTIEGIVTDVKGNLASGFNGTIFPTVFDKKSNLQTLSNDIGSPKYSFTAYKNILFKGSATVAGGKWTISFWVPKNINYTYGNGKISLYATDGSAIDASGVYNNIIIGGTSETFVSDDQGPQMDMYMNDRSFVSGGLTSANPNLLLHLSDNFGINVTGNAVGQDITAILDGDQKNVFILNDFYEAEKDDFAKGKVTFPLTGLTNGSHYIIAKAWDISGNSTERRIDFIVAEDGNVTLKHVYNYPNPFTTNTLFQFEHDLTNTELDVIVNIYTITGKLIKSITQTKYSSGFRVNDIGWNGKDDFESSLARGLYLYKIIVQSKELNLTRESKFEKLIKL
ncbi:MAG: type IX secretion system sortase PorU [Saprospiraceae bacterium]